MNARQLSHELREETSADLRRRRWIVGLSVAGVAAGIAVTLYQTGIIKHLPDPPLPFLDSDRVDASDYAYSRLNAPDAPLMIANYGVTTLLAAMGGKNRAAEMPLAPIGLFAKTLTDAVVCLELSREEWKEQRAFCSYCQAATLISIASTALAAPEAIKAAQTLLGGGQQRQIEGENDFNQASDENYRAPLERAIPA